MRRALATLVPTATLVATGCYAESLPDHAEQHRIHFERHREALDQLTTALRSEEAVDHVFLFRNEDGDFEVLGSSAREPERALEADLQAAFLQLLNAANVGSVRQSETSSRIYLGPTTVGDLYWNAYFVNFVEPRPVNNECASILLSQAEGACEVQLSPNWWLTLSWFTQPE